MILVQSLKILDRYVYVEVERYLFSFVVDYQLFYFESIYLVQVFENRYLVVIYVF